MTISMFQASVPVFVRGLENLQAILGKAQVHAAQKQINPQVFTQARLFPDMFPLTHQIYIATNTAKGSAARLAGLEIPKYDDVEASFDELDARIRKTLAYLKGFKAEQIDGSESRTVTLEMHSKPVQFTGLSYLLTFALPNFYFHVTTAYNILRHNGVEIGKADYLGKLPA